MTRAWSKERMRVSQGRVMRGGGGVAGSTDAVYAKINAMTGT